MGVLSRKENDKVKADEGDQVKQCRKDFLINTKPHRLGRRERWGFWGNRYLQSIWKRVQNSSWRADPYCFRLSPHCELV